MRVIDLVMPDIGGLTSRVLFQPDAPIEVLMHGPQLSSYWYSRCTRGHREVFARPPDTIVCDSAVPTPVLALELQLGGIPGQPGWLHSPCRCGRCGSSQRRVGRSLLYPQRSLV
jgi:hypothetical protein